MMKLLLETPSEVSKKYETVVSSTVGHEEMSYLVVTSNIRHASVLSGQLVLDTVDSVVFNVDRSDQEVVGDVVKVTTEFEPGSSGTDVVCGTLPLHLEMEKKEDERMRNKGRKRKCL